MSSRLSTSTSAMLMTLVIFGSACTSEDSIGSPAEGIVQNLLRKDSHLRVGPDVWETFICRIPETYDDDLYDMSGVRLVESADWITAQLEPVTDYFERWSNGRYVAEFRVGGDIHGDVGGAEECVDVALDRSAEDVDGVLVVADAQHREDRVGGWGRGGHQCDAPCSVRESKRAIYLGAADFVSGPVVLDLVEHEFGHALDWPHSFRYEPYDSEIDVMSDSAAPRRKNVMNLHAPGVLAINRYLSGWMEIEPFVLDATAGGVIDIDSARFGLVPTAPTRAISVEVIDKVSDYQHLESGGVVVHLIDWGPRSCDNPVGVNGVGGRFCLGAARSQRLMAPVMNRDGVIRSGERVDVDGVTIIVESITEVSGSMTASIRWEMT
ncbi:MAG: hypothetical protein ACKOI2_13120 [Actinomycetota bacterium]